MTGPALGKLKLDAKVYAITKKELLVSAEVYIHLKGYALAKVTHLDIEHESFSELIKPKTGKFLNINWIPGGIEIDFNDERPIYKNEELKAIKIYSKVLSRILKPKQCTKTWVGGKLGGIYIGFRKKEMKKLEKIVEKLFRIET